MAVGQSNNPKVLFIIQARMQSTRLPGKIIMPLPIHGGPSLLKRIVDSLKTSKWQKEIVLATSLHSANDGLQDFAVEEDISCYRGSEDDVLSRFIEIVQQKYADIVVRVTADNPFLDISLLDELIDHHWLNKNEYTKSSGLPIGMNFEIVQPTALKELSNQELSADDHEHVTLFIRNHAKKQENVLLGNSNLERLRLTVDYPSDFIMASTLFGFFGENEPVSIEKIQEIYQNYPWIFELNQRNLQKSQYKNNAEELSEAITLLENLDFKFSSQLLKKHLRIK